MQEFADFLGSQPPFDALSADDLTRLARQVEVEYFAAGMVIVPADAQPLDHLYVIRTGAVEITDRGRTVDGFRRVPAGQWRGELGFLAAISPTVHRLALEMSDRQASALAHAIAETDAVPPEVAKLRGIALAGVFQIIITEAGRRTREGQTQNQIANELRPAIEVVLDDLDRWLTPATD